MKPSLTTLTALREILLHTQQLYSWHADEACRLVFCNCPGAPLYYEIFRHTAGFAAAEGHFQNSDRPVLFTDRLGLSWLLARPPVTTPGRSWQLLGPAFTVWTTGPELQLLCRQACLPERTTQRLLGQYQTAPLLSPNLLKNFGCSLHYCLTGEALPPAAVAVLQTPAPNDRSAATAEATESFVISRHNTWLAESEFIATIRAGKARAYSEIMALFDRRKIGRMCPDNALRQAQDEGLVLAVLGSRAAILGGVSAEGAYNLCDYYIQKLESCQTLSAVELCSEEMYEAFLRRVRQARKNQRYSAAVCACREYVLTHVTEKLPLTQLAAALGYTSYYLSARFRRETGQSLGAFIWQQKIDLAKLLLQSSGTSMSFVSEYLAFSSPSHFSAIFKRLTGQTPRQYQNRPHQ